MSPCGRCTDERLSESWVRAGGCRNNNWSYSWAVANSLRLYFANSKNGLRAREVRSPDQLLLGDVICYDFEGDGRFNHNTIVTGKDALWNAISECPYL